MAAKFAGGGKINIVSIWKVFFSELIIVFLISSGLVGLSTQAEDIEPAGVVVDSNPEEIRILDNLKSFNGYFTENLGQVGNSDVRYYIQGKGIWFLDNAVVFQISKEQYDLETQADQFELPPPDFESENPGQSHAEKATLKLNFEDANIASPEGSLLLPHKSNYFYGNDPSKWCTDVSNYAEIIYRNIYNNIDLKYYSTPSGLKYDFIVHPEGIPTDIKLRYDGAQDLNVESSCDIRVQTHLGEVMDSNLFIYQESGESKTPLIGKFIITAPMTYGFEIGEGYDREKDLIIDPLVYSTFVGGSSYDKSNDIKIDSSGNVYVTGIAASNDFPTTANANDTTYNKGNDAFVLKLNPSGTSIIYSTYIGGSGEEECYGLDIYDNGDAYIVGYTSSIDFPTTSNANDTTFNGEQDIFVLKLGSSGSSLMYSTYIGGNRYDHGLAIQIDYSGNAYIAGTTRSDDFPTSANAIDTIHNGYGDGYLLKLDPTGSKIIYSTFIGGVNSDRIECLEIDKSGCVYFAGVTGSPNLPTTAKAYDSSHNGRYDGFAGKLDSSGSSLKYMTYIGGVENDLCHDVTVDKDGNAYLTGLTESFDLETTKDAFKKYIYGSSDVFIIKLSPDGSKFLYSTFIGGIRLGSSYDEGANGIELDSDGNIYVSGWTFCEDFPTTPGAYDTDHNGLKDVFFLKMDPTGSYLKYSTFIGGAIDDKSSAMVLDSERNPYITGFTHSKDFPYTNGSNDTSMGGNCDGFILKFYLGPPVATDIYPSKSIVKRTETVTLYANATDVDDEVFKLRPYFEYMDSNDVQWNATHFSEPKYIDSEWQVSFTPPKNATLGCYDFRVRFNDTDKLVGHWLYSENQLTVVNNHPRVENLILSSNKAVKGEIISIWANGFDAEQSENELAIELEYSINDDQLWETAGLSEPEYVNDKWEYTFSIPFVIPLGYFDFRVKFSDSDLGWSCWYYENNSLIVYNDNPKLLDVQFSKTSVLRTDSVNLYINATDDEASEADLKCYVQYNTPDDESEWHYISGGYSSNRWSYAFKTEKDFYLGTYDFRVEFEDNYDASSGWIYINDSLEVCNNLPAISSDLDGLDVGLSPEIIYLTQYESDIEDSDTDLVWSVSNNYRQYFKSVKIIDEVNDILFIEPHRNIDGFIDIELTLTDSDGDSVTRTDVTVQINSWVTEHAPRTSLLYPPDNGIIDTRNPKLVWELDYTGNERVTYDIYLDTQADPIIPIKSDYRFTSYELEIPLEDNKTYYWKVIPSNGICDSGQFSFTVDLGSNPVYKVGLSVERDYIELRQGEAVVVNFTIRNDGNVADVFMLDCESKVLESVISLDTINVRLDREELAVFHLIIDLPSDFEIGVFPLSVKATSFSDSLIKSEITINLEVIDKDYWPIYEINAFLTPTFVEVEPGKSVNVILTIINQGNLPDYYTINFVSDEFTTSNIQLGKISGQLNPGDREQIRITIDVNDIMTEGKRKIKFEVVNDNTSTDTTLTIDVKKSESSESKSNQFSSVSVSVIIAVLIILFLLVFRRKPGKEDAKEGEKEELPPPTIPPSAALQEVQEDTASPERSNLPTPAQQPQSPKLPPSLTEESK
ncbi:MAG: SBBP repeat-containing protein [Thermoplasmata archaeon]|nr:MAG: SBBP repeat-containing protein [Thermoplasmata archaeon]